MNLLAPVQKKSFRFRARSFVAFALAPEAPLDDWLHELDSWTANSPGFFAGRPVVLDLNMLRPKPAEVAALVAQLAERGMSTARCSDAYLPARRATAGRASSAAGTRPSCSRWTAGI